MDESIFNTIKKMLGLEADYSPFDTDIVAQINGVFLILQQLGIGPTAGFQISGSDEVWSDFVDDAGILGAVKTYIYLKIRSVFDPPSSGTVADALQKQISEYEWRLNMQKDFG